MSPLTKTILLGLAEDALLAASNRGLVAVERVVRVADRIQVRAVGVALWPVVALRDAAAWVRSLPVGELDLADAKTPPAPVVGSPSAAPSAAPATGVGVVHPSGDA